MGGGSSREIGISGHKTVVSKPRDAAIIIFTR